jgi:hypothetical protein
MPGSRSAVFVGTPFVQQSEVGMTTAPDTEIHRRSLVSSEPATFRNSPLLYGLGSFGLESAYKVFWGFYVFYYVDVLGPAVTLATLINVVYSIWDAVNDPLAGVPSDNTRTRWGRGRRWRALGGAEGGEDWLLYLETQPALATGQANAACPVVPP